ncbi:MAG: hypothetical protein JW861_01860 [Bacteroidales bacterium]|nr:hypothetical protein [Bacteroidales bacterium]
MLQVHHAVFPDNTWGGYYNVTKISNTGYIKFVDATGGFSGEAYDEDPWGLVDWALGGGITVNLTAFLEGPFNGTGMDTDLTSFIPLSQPYSSAPWCYTGTESVASVPADVVDWMLVELRDAPSAPEATAATMIARKAVFMRNDGQLHATGGETEMPFNVTVNDGLFVVLWHRNHLGIMSASPLTGTGGAYSLDFSISPGIVYGGTNGHKEIGSGIWGMIAGDGNADGQINNGDKIDVWAVQAGTGGYMAGDFNMDAQVNNGDKNDMWKPNTGLGGQVPESGGGMYRPSYTCQVPE